MICYQKTNGLAHDLRLVPEDYIANLGETLINGDALPSVDSLSDAGAIALRDAPKPDVEGFINGLKAAMGGAVAANALMRQYPMFYAALSTGTWVDVQALIIDAHATGTLTDAAYAAFKSISAQHNIPVALP